MAETYADWNTYERGNATRLVRLNLRISYLQSKLDNGDYTVEGKSHTFDSLQKHLAELWKIEKEESAVASSSSSGRRATFTRGRVL